MRLKRMPRASQLRNCRNAWLRSIRSKAWVNWVPTTPTERPLEPDAIDCASSTVTRAPRSIRLTAVNRPSVPAPMTTT